MKKTDRISSGKYDRFLFWTKAAAGDRGHQDRRRVRESKKAPKARW